jgi:hypothetical protein
MTNETAILQQFRMAASDLGLTLFRNNSGSLQDKNGRWVRFGLCKGSADLIGWHNGTGKFVAIEVKRPGQKPHKEQTLFLDAVRKAGGIAGVAYSPDDLKIILADNVAT